MKVERGPNHWLLSLMQHQAAPTRVRVNAANELLSFSLRKNL